MGEPPEPDAASGDADASRLDALRAWLADVLPQPMTAIAPASVDASFRRYFRVWLAEAVVVPAQGERACTLIAMDAPPSREDCRAYVAVGKLLLAAGVHAPAVLATDLQQGFLLLTDLGTRMYFDALDEASAPALYGEASTALVRWQLASRDGQLRPYDEALLRGELDLFPDWYIARHLGVVLTLAQRTGLDRVFRT